jgi:hypothetical protein
MEMKKITNFNKIKINKGRKRQGIKGLPTP